MPLNHNFSVGQRLSFQGQLCTIRYIGEVRGAENEWLGVEWNDPSRGKHDGKGYFKCLSKAANPASFIRPTRKPDPEQSFVEAVFHKYASGDAINPDTQIVISGKVAEEVGFNKIAAEQARVHELKIVLVDGQRINRAHTKPYTTKSSDTPTVDLAVVEACPSIVELDLSRNLFRNLDEIEKICGQLKNLKALRLNGNRLELDRSKISNAIEEVFNTIKTLELDETLIKWDDICILMQRFISTTSLTASSNGFKKLNAPITISSLTSLTLEYNEFTALTDLEVLTQLTSLESLLLKGNKIYTTGTMIGPGAVKTFNPLIFNKNLSYIDLSSNEIENWEFIDELVHIFPGMTSLRLSKNPLFPESISESVYRGLSVESMTTIARLRKLQKLNFSSITREDRDTAEVYYLYKIGQELEAVKPHEESTVLSRHKRYNELCEIHGRPVVAKTEEAGIDPAFLEARLIKFTFYIPAEPEFDQKEITLVKEIPKTFNMYRVKGIVGRLFNVRPWGLRLIWETGEWDPVAGFEDIDEYSSDEDKGLDQVGEALTHLRVKSKGGESGREIEKVVAKTHEQPGKFMKREVELEDTTKDVGLLVSEMEARVRVEIRN